MEVRAWTLLGELAARLPSVREPVASLSGGQRQTVAIARSLLLDPQVVMLDEPTAALGVAQTAEVLNLIERLRERGHGVILISHNMENVRAVADRIVVLRLGRNNGIFAADTSHEDIIAAIMGASDNAVTRREGAQARNGGELTMSQTKSDTSTRPHLDRADTRVRHDEGLVGALRAFLDRVRSGDLGMLPVIVGLILISMVFTSLNPVFLAPNNLANLLFDASAVGLISLGVVLVLLLGEIDLSIGSMSGLSSALLGLMWVSLDLPMPIAIIGASSPAPRSGSSTASCATVSKCRASSPRSPGFWRCSACSSTFWVRPARSTCPSPPIWWRSASSRSCRPGCPIRLRWLPARWWC